MTFSIPPPIEVLDGYDHRRRPNGSLIRIFTAATLPPPSDPGWKSYQRSGQTGRMIKIGHPFDLAAAAGPLLDQEGWLVVDAQGALSVVSEADQVRDYPIQS
jgi:hypothetical protein